MKFLIIRLSSLGDIVHALPLVRRIKGSYQNVQVDWLVGKAGFNFLKLIKEIDHVYDLNPQNIFFIQKQNYDYVIDVQGLFKSALFARLSFGKNVIGFKNTREFASIFYDKKIDVGNLFKTNKHVIELNLELFKSILYKECDNKNIKFSIPEVEEPNNPYFLKLLEKKWIGRNNSILIFPATTWKSKLWNIDYWYGFIKNISRDFNISICGSSSDLIYCNPLINKLEASNIKYENLISKTSFNDLIFLIQKSALVIGMDSFGLHLTSAIKNDFGKVQLIGIYGPTSPLRNGPYPINHENYLYLSDLECISCRKKTCPLGHHRCMNDIGPQDVINMVYSKVGAGFKPAPTPNP